ncbi:uncharacterized protein THITE_20354, partial [Thermothielavioides terrestris NRRL 8126]
FKDFYRIKLILNYIYCNPNKLKTIDNIVFKIYYKAYIYCLKVHQHPNNYYSAIIVPKPEEEFK